MARFQEGVHDVGKGKCIVFQHLGEGQDPVARHLGRVADFVLVGEVSAGQ